MITIDDREQSSIFINHLPHGLVQVSRLQYGDASFVGNGPREEPVLVGIERKAIGDLINSITSGRFAGHQLPGLLHSYHVVYLVVEGLYRPSGSGILEIRTGRDWHPLDRGRRWMYADLDCWLTTMEQKAGIKVRRASGPSETAAILLSIYRWWTSKDYSEHRAHLTMHTPPETATLMKASLVRVIAATLPGIGWTKSELAAKKFKSVIEMMEADEKDWMSIEGVGKITAERIVKAVWGDGVRRVKERRA